MLFVVCLCVVVFRVYDVDNNGKISRHELFKVLKRMVGTNINDEQLSQLVDKVILDSKHGREPDDDAEYDFITKEDFVWSLANSQLQTKLSLRL